MFIGSKTEFDQLRTKIKDKKCTSVTEVRNMLEIHFRGIEWSLLKGEWDNMSQKERSDLAHKLFEEL